VEVAGAIDGCAITPEMSRMIDRIAIEFEESWRYSTRRSHAAMCAIS
jgi:hypothetical protein